jgi:hypothetical protein
MMKKFAIIIFIAAVHFAMSALVVASFMSVADAINPAQTQSLPVFRILVVATRILHFPIISLSLYSRQWFPGNWIYMPIFFNSLLWAVGIYFLMMLAKNIKEKKRNGNGH